MKLTEKKNMSEEMVFAQELSDDELENISGGQLGGNHSGCDGLFYSGCAEMFEWDSQHCVRLDHRNIYEGAFPNCAATVESGSWCNENDACVVTEVRYSNMNDCSKAWR